MVSDIYSRLFATRAKFVALKEKKIKFGLGEKWKDVEADEVDVSKGETKGATPSSTPVTWEQWGGIVERGAPESLVLFRLNPAKTKRRAPGPGPIRKRDWAPLARKWLKGRSVILHTDGARSYKLKVDGVKHDWVVHSRKSVTINGVQRWVKPHYSKLRWHMVEDGAQKKKLWVKSGTQIIDRCWQGLRKHLGTLSTGPKSKALTHKVRSFQWEYWNRGEDLWLQTGVMVKYLFDRERAE
jgi:hypothetical protein